MALVVVPDYADILLCYGKTRRGNWGSHALGHPFRYARKPIFTDDYVVYRNRIALWRHPPQCIVTGTGALFFL
jgi:hypothetical protein